MIPRCLITGATLFEVGEGRCKPCDLFRVGDCLVVNASGEGEIRRPSSAERLIMYSADRSHYFERRNVFIFAGSFSEHLNQSAQEYIRSSP